MVHHGLPNYPHQNYTAQKQRFNKALLRDEQVANNPLMFALISGEGSFDGDS